jgi:hypothetical protein
MVVKQYCAVIFAALYADENDLIDPVRTGQASKRRFYARNVSIVSSIILGLIEPLLKLCEVSIAILRFVTCYPLIFRCKLLDGGGSWNRGPQNTGQIQTQSESRLSLSLSKSRIGDMTKRTLATEPAGDFKF